MHYLKKTKKIYYVHQEDTNLLQLLCTTTRAKKTIKRQVIFFPESFLDSVPPPVRRGHVEVPLEAQIFPQLGSPEDYSRISRFPQISIFLILLYLGGDRSLLLPPSPAILWYWTTSWSVTSSPNMTDRAALAWRRERWRWVEEGSLPSFPGGEGEPGEP